MKFVQIAFLAVCGLASLSQAQQQRIPEPVPILKQISKQNDDGSYSFGYEGGDGSFKIETKYPDGSVQGKYGYVDDTGKLREVEYGASSKRGFEPQGNDINVPPPTLSNDKAGPLGEGEEDDGQYREDPSIYDTKEYRSNLPVQKQAARRPAAQYQPVRHSFQQPIQYEQPAQQTYTTVQQPSRQTFSSFNQQPTFQNSLFQQSTQPKYSGVQNTFPRFQQNDYYQQPQQQQSYVEPQQNYVQQSYTQQPRYNTYQQPQQAQQAQQPQQPQYSGYNFHPSIRNFDIGSGSYSINYSGR